MTALRQLLDHADRTELAFEVTLALDGGTGERILEQMVRHPEGRRLIVEQPCLLDTLCDRAALEAMPMESFGRAYLEHIDRYGLEPSKLIELGRATGTDGGPEEPLVRWASHRGSLGHDLSHVLSGYGADQLGEATLLAFNLGQMGGRANLLLTLGASSRAMRYVGLRWLPYILKAWRRGRAAACLNALPFEDLLPLPLDDVRAMALIEPPHIAHPGGVLNGDVAATAS